MTVFHIEKEQEGTWFPFFSSRVIPETGEIIYDKPEEGAAEFCFRSMSPFFEERRKGRKKTSQMVFNPKTRSMEKVTFLPDLSPEEDAQENDDAWDYAITGIRKAFSGNRKPIECTRENKLMLVKVPMFFRYAQEVFRILDSSSVEKSEVEKENF